MREREIRIDGVYRKVGDEDEGEEESKKKSEVGSTAGL